MPPATETNSELQSIVGQVRFEVKVITWQPVGYRVIKFLNMQPVYSQIFHYSDCEFINSINSSIDELHIFQGSF